MNHTPGPWFLDVHPDKTKAVLVDKEGFSIIYLSKPFPNSLSKDARLIAAAPELLGELVKMTDAYAEAMKDAGVTHYPEALVVVRQARAAIAKAGGGVTMDEYKKLVQECAEQGKALARLLANNGTIETLYLYARPSEPGKPGALFLARDSAPNPHGYQLITGEGLRGNIPFDEFFQWIYNRAKFAPILSID